MIRIVVLFLRIVVALIVPLWATVASAQEYRIRDGHTLEHSKEVIKLAFAPDGKTIATLCREGGIRAWDVESGKETWKLDDEPARLYLLGFMDATTLVVGRFDDRKKDKIKDTVEVWDLTKKELRRSITLSGTRGYRDMASGSNILVVRGDGEEKPGMDLWDVNKGEKVGHLAQEKEPCLYSFTHDGTKMAVATKTEVHIWDLATRKETVIIPLKRRPEGIALRLDGKILFVAPNNADPMLIYDIPSGELQDKTPCKCAWDNGMGFTSDGKVLVTNEFLSLLTSDTGKRLLLVDAGYTRGIQRLVTSPKGNLVATSLFQGKQVRLSKIEEKEP